MACAHDKRTNMSQMKRKVNNLLTTILLGFSTSPSSTSNQQSMEMRNRGALNKKSGTLMSFGVVHDKYTKGIDITQVCIKSLLLCSQGQKII